MKIYLHQGKATLMASLLKPPPGFHVTSTLLRPNMVIKEWTRGNVATQPVTFFALYSQVDVHSPWGGVVPNLASEAHKQAMDGTIQEALRQANLEMGQLDAVAVTIGPGLSLCLKVATKPCRQCSLPITLPGHAHLAASVSHHRSQPASDHSPLNGEKTLEIVSG